ncbi:MAG: tRNA isopentenyl-2-thiomethyl-A-37 hydroxylase MiaE, partial [Myxococcota bacterium]
ARGCELGAINFEDLEDEALAYFKRDRARAEARHHALFIRLARVYIDPADVRARLDELLDAEAAIVDRLPLRARLH